MIVLGAPETDAVDRIRALEDGADDVLVRPFHYEELLARIRAVLRRVSPEPHERLAAGELRIDRATRRVTVRGEPVALAGKEFELLVKLASDPYRVFTKEQLLREVWGFRSLGRTRTLDSHASRLGASSRATARGRSCSTSGGWATSCSMDDRAARTPGIRSRAWR